VPVPIDLDVLRDLGDVIQRLHRTGTATLQLETRHGKKMPWPDGEIKVSIALWKGAVKMKGW